MKTIKSQISGRVLQLKREREVHRMSTATTLVSVVDNQQAVMTVASQMPSTNSNPAASVNRQCSQEKDGYADG